MRQDRTVQASIFDLFAKHEIGCELKKASAWLDEHPALIGLVAGDLRRDGVQETGRQGLSAEAVLRCALLKQYRQLSYEELAFHLEDSASFRAFARLPWAWSPKKSVLHKTIGAIRAETWEAVNRTLLVSARQEKVEDGSVVRLDSTATAALMHQPSDSSLLGGFKWLSQHLDGGGCDEGWETALGSGATSRVAAIAWPTRRGSA
jgi:transposase, IS5 family